MRNNFTAVRLLLSIMVLLAHSAPVTGYPLFDFELYVFHGLNMTIGTMALHMFFAISGYLITLSFSRCNSFAVFAQHRALRLAPGLIVAVLLSNAVKSHFNLYIGNPMDFTNVSLWTLSWEVCCYFAVGMLGLLGLLSRRSFNLFFAVLWLFYLNGVQVVSRYHAQIEPMLMFFAMGAFIAINESEINIKKMALAAVVVLAVLFTPTSDALLMQAIHFFPEPFEGTISNWAFRNILYFTFLPFLTIYLCKHAPAVPFWKRDISYGTYIYGWPVEQVVMFLGLKHGMHLSPWPLFGLSLIPVLVIGYLSSLLIEEPALRLKRRGKSRPPQPNRIDLPST